MKEYTKTEDVFNKKNRADYDQAVMTIIGRSKIPHT